MVFRTIVIADQKEDRMLKYHHFMLKDKRFSHPFVSLEVVESLLRRQVMGICFKELALVVLKCQSIFATEALRFASHTDSSCLSLSRLSIRLIRHCRTCE